MMKRLAFIILLTTQLVGSVPAQQPRPTPTPSPAPTQQQPESDEVVRITTNLVQVDAVVTDKNGSPVTDLKPEEVEIYEDGREQKITNFSFNLLDTAKTETPAPTPRDKNAAPVPLPPSQLKPEDVRRTIAVVVDDLGLSFESTYYVRRALKKFVDEQMQPGDLVAVFRTSGGVGALQQFTADKRQLYAAIERLKYVSTGRSGLTPIAPLNALTSKEEEMDSEAVENLNQFRDDMYAVGTLGSVSYVVRGLKELPGRKSVLLISEGFRISSLDDPTRTLRTKERLQRLVDEAGRASVVIYTINAMGLQPLGFTAQDDTSGMSSSQIGQVLSDRSTKVFETQEGLDSLAKQTGGLAIKNSNDLSRGIRRVIEDQKGYYLIGYRPSEETFSNRSARRLFHHLSLKIKRPGKFNVRMRNGFYGVTDEASAKPRTMVQQMVHALTSPFGASGVHLQLTSLFANDANIGSFMRSILQIDPRDLTFTDEPGGFHKSVFDVLAITFGDSGVPIDQLGKTYTLQMSDADYKRTLREGLVYYVTVPIKKAGAYQLRVALRDTTTERIGSASQFIEAPDLKKNRLALSGIVLRGDERNQTSATAKAPGENEGVESGSAEASAGVRRFKRGMVLTYAFFIYNARPDKATARPQLVTQVRLFRDGKEVFTGRENPYSIDDQTDMKRLAASGAIQLGGEMVPGEYILQVVVTDLLAGKKNRTTTQWMDFQIVN
ncbi:MAG TPA: VWA domain-containing protein [Pyrinomonadaceae bacterium]|nr:VWA domain-containing protein [Pyrinomonadaceae bacterium]